MKWLKLIFAAIVAALLTYKFGVWTYGKGEWDTLLPACCFTICLGVTYFITEGFLFIMFDDDGYNR